MRVPEKSTAMLEKLSALPWDWLPGDCLWEWAARSGDGSNKPAMLVNKVNLDALPGLAAWEGSPAF